jgi:uncharacterized integral membrane protein
MKHLRRVKLTALAVLAVLLLVLVAQNTGTTTIRFFGWELEASRIVLFSGFTLAGFAAGMLTTVLLERRQHRKDSASADAPEPD